MGENILMMRCTQCGEMNRLPVVHCKTCGARLDFETAEKQMIESAQPTLQDRIRNGCKLGLALAFLLAILLMIWPGRMTRTYGEEIDAKRYRMKGELLIEALNRGLPASQVIEEKEINAHFREIVAAQPAARGGLASRVVDVGARFYPGRAEVFIAVKRGPFTFTGHFRARPQGAKLVVTGARAGHLPLPGLLGRAYAATTSGVFRQLKNESRILRNLDGVQVSDGTIELLTKAGN